MILVLAISFLAATLAVFALGLVFRDATANRTNDLDRRLGLDTAEADEIALLIDNRRPNGRLDRWFLRLLDESGSQLDYSTAGMILGGAAVIGCAAPLLLFDTMLGAIAGLVVAFSLPLMFWSVKRILRLRRLRKDLPETLDQLADAVRSGRNLEQAAEMVASNNQGPLAEEFGYCAAQLKLGHGAVPVLERMVRRVNLPEFKIFAIAVLVHRQTGGSLATLTARLATAARDRAEFLGHLGAVTAGGRLSAIGLVLGALFGVCVIFWIQPDYLRTFVEHRLGPPLLATAGVLYLVGAIWVWRILKVSY
ncbi:MAG: type II secretion system F family protein [Pirellulales bacterium]